jgi:hypothetical protein
MRVTLELTDTEATALATLTAGVAGLAERSVGTEAAVVAAIDLGLSRLIDDFEVPDPAVRQQLRQARELLRRDWRGGNACL